MNIYIINKTKELIDSGTEPDYESISISEFLQEFDYATKYLSRLLKVRGFVIYILLFKRAYFIEGSRNITIKLSEIGRNLLSDLGQPMSHDVVKRGTNDLIKIGIVERLPSRPGQVNEYIVKLPSELRQVQEMIENDKNESPIEYDDSRDDFYTDKMKRLEILKRDAYKCFYCLCELKQDNYYLDHIFPQANGGHNWKSNLVSSCRTCNTKKTATNADPFLLENYRKGLMAQPEYLEQKSKLEKLKSEYEKIKNTAANKA